MKRLAPIVSAVTAVALALLLALPACVDRGDGNSNNSGSARATQVQQPEDALDEELMVTLLQAKNFHHMANVYQLNGQLEKAAAEIAKILSIKFPADAAEAVDAVLDARARLAKLLMKLDKHAEAMTIVEAGLATAKRESFFVANLYTVKGHLHEARVRALKDSKDDDDKKAFRAHSIEAIKSLRRSQKINTTIQKRLMKGMAP